MSNITLQRSGHPDLLIFYPKKNLRSLLKPKFFCLRFGVYCIQNDRLGHTVSTTYSTLIRVQGPEISPKRCWDLTVWFGEAISRKNKWYMTSNYAYNIQIWYKSIWLILVSKESSGPQHLLPMIGFRLNFLFVKGVKIEKAVRKFVPLWIFQILCIFDQKFTVFKGRIQQNLNKSNWKFPIGVSTHPPPPQLEIQIKKLFFY